MTLDEAIKHCEEVAEENDLAAGMYEILAENNHNAYEKLTAETNSLRCAECAADHRQLAEWLRDLKEAKRLLQAAEKTIDDYCRGYCECCKNRDFALARCGLVNGCRDKDNWEWILSYRVKELFKEG